MCHGGPLNEDVLLFDVYVLSTSCWMAAPLEEPLFPLLFVLIKLFNYWALYMVLVAGSTGLGRLDISENFGKE